MVSICLFSCNMASAFTQSQSALALTLLNWNCDMLLRTFVERLAKAVASKSPTLRGSANKICYKPHSFCHRQREKDVLCSGGSDRSRCVSNFLRECKAHSSETRKPSRVRLGYWKRFSCCRVVLCVNSVLNLSSRSTYLHAPLYSNLLSIRNIIAGSWEDGDEIIRRKDDGDNALVIAKQKAAQTNNKTTEKYISRL